MSLHRDADGTMVLAGVCAAADADELLQALRADPATTVDWRGCTQVHTAVVQVMLALRPPVRGPCGEAFVARWLASATGRP